MTDEFVAGLVIGAGCAASAFVGLDEQSLTITLYHVRLRILALFANDPHFADAVADGFVAAVRNTKAEIESAWPQGES